MQLDAFRDRKLCHLLCSTFQQGWLCDRPQGYSPPNGALLSCCDYSTAPPPPPPPGASISTTSNQHDVRGWRYLCFALPFLYLLFLPFCTYQSPDRLARFHHSPSSFPVLHSFLQLLCRPYVFANLLSCQSCRHICHLHLHLHLHRLRRVRNSSPHSRRSPPLPAQCNDRPNLLTLIITVETKSCRKSQLAGESSGRCTFRPLCFPQSGADADVLPLAGGPNT